MFDIFMFQNHDFILRGLLKSSDNYLPEAPPGCNPGNKPARKYSVITLPGGGGALPSREAFGPGITFQVGGSTW